MADKITSIALAIFFLFSCAGGSLQEKGAIAGVEPIANIYLHENHSESLSIWKEHDLRNRILVHFDGHIDMDWIPEVFIKEIQSCRTADDIRRRIAHPYEMKSGYEGMISIWNFIYPAARLGIIREFYWVVPDGTFNRKNLLEDLRSLLAIKMHGVTPAELQVLTLHENRISGKVLGVPTTILELDYLPKIREPVLLDIDVDYFTTDSAIDQKVLLDPSLHPDEFIKRIAHKKILTDIVTISYSSVGGFLPVSCHHYGDIIQERLRNPASKKSKKEFEQEAVDDPILKDADLHQADAMRGAGQIDEAKRLYRKYISQHPEGSHRLYAKFRLATAFADVGPYEQAFRLLGELLSESPDIADARYYLARLYRESGNLREAIVELREAVKLDRFNGIYAAELGSCLLVSGYESEALEWLQKSLEFKPCNGNAHLTLAFHFARKGDMENAAEELKSALFVRPWDVDARFQLGTIYFHQKKLKEAREELEKVLRIAPAHAMARNLLSKLND
ncbi:MAG: tetratricopeptide repeat protein [Acidobacteriota bacterium]